MTYRGTTTTKRRRRRMMTRMIASLSKGATLWGCRASLVQMSVVVRRLALPRSVVSNTECR